MITKENLYKYKDKKTLKTWSSSVEPQQSNKDVKEFKDLMSRYYYYSDKIDKLIDEKEYTFHLIGGIHSPALDGSSGSTNLSVKEEKKLALSEKIKRLDDDISRVSSTYNYLNSVLELMPQDYKSMCISVLARGKSYREVAKDYGYDVGWFWRKLDKAISRAINLYNN